ncbi:hypothetical protein P3T36_001923 [Kitasatospora sp. MAP12-15]|nr:hypothetical protein [Kitasatospora sp. MAP12-44]
MLIVCSGPLVRASALSTSIVVEVSGRRVSSRQAPASRAAASSSIACSRPPIANGSIRSLFSPHGCNCSPGQRIWTTNEYSVDTHQASAVHPPGVTRRSNGNECGVVGMGGS